ncbi:MAG TPA: nuclear transport factor 2 family protein [Acidimicrobiales bacterium]|nr:nuclear transport factor 2 family protein [Acidimicrobiales bacterium]
MTTDLDSVTAANKAFYAAFEGRDLDAMSLLWEHSDRIVCTHPGWASLRGWGQVAASFFALFQNSQHLQFILTKEKAEVAGDVGWVTVDENILQTDSASTVSALNLFVRDKSGDWKLVAHHASPVTDTAEVET